MFNKIILFKKLFFFNKNKYHVLKVRYKSIKIVKHITKYKLYSIRKSQLTQL